MTAARLLALAAAACVLLSAAEVDVAAPKDGDGDVLVEAMEEHQGEDLWNEGIAKGSEKESVQSLKLTTELISDPANMDTEKIASMVEQNLDSNVSPCDDFYQHACGSWLQTTKLPNDHAAWTRSFNEISKNVKAKVKGILDGKIKLPETEMAKRDVKAQLAKLHTFYDACNDDAALQKMGLQPIKEFLAERLPEITHLPSFMKVLAGLGEIGLDHLFSFGIDVDPKHPLKHITSLGMGGLGLPDKSYYSKKQYKKMLKTKYLPFLQASIESVWASPLTKSEAKQSAEDVLQFETDLAKIIVDRTLLRDPVKNYHKFTQEQLYRLSPMLKQYFANRKRNADFWKYSPKLFTSTPTFFKGLDKLLRKTFDTERGVQTIKAYMAVHLKNTLAPSLSDEASFPLFQFYSMELSGVKTRSARWKRCFYSAQGNLRDILARAFVSVAFTGVAKSKASAMIRRIEDAFGGTLKQLTWLDSTTRAKAEVKLKALVDMIGYPTKWRVYKSEITGNNFKNILALTFESNEHNLKQLYKGVDRSEWDMSPAQVNAYYSPGTNRIVFPAAILQPPFFDEKMPMAVNFGGIGMVMGHELTHGFDDQGRLYGPDGALNNWWLKKTSNNFVARAQCISKEYSSFQLPGKPAAFVNGNLTLGENLADNGGLQNSYKAYVQWASEQDGGLAAQKFGRFSGEQLFFYSFAQAWCEKQTVRAERQQAVTDPHSPNKFRVNGPVRNTAGFAKAFGCKAGSKMSPIRGQCLVWTPDPARPQGK